MQKAIFLDSLKHTAINLSPHRQIQNPVMFVTYLGALFSTAYVIYERIHGTFSGFNLQIAIWMWMTVLFANFAQSLAESKGRAQALFLRRMQGEIRARVLDDDQLLYVPATELKKGMVIECKAGDIIPADGEVIEGIATVDESAITGESAPVIRESGGDRSAVTAGTKVVSDAIKIRITSDPGKTFLDRIINLVESSERKKTPNEIALMIVLATLTIVFLLTVSSLKIFSDYSVEAFKQEASFITLPTLIALLVCLIPTTIGALLSAIGISGMNRLIHKNVIAKSGRSVEAAGDVDVLLLDKTGTITLGNRMAVNFIPIGDASEKELARISQIASLSDETPEGRSIVVLAKNRYGLRADEVNKAKLKFIPFSAKTSMSGVDVYNDVGKVTQRIRKGSYNAIKEHLEHMDGFFPKEAAHEVERIAFQGGTPLVVTVDKKIIGIIHLKDVVKGGIRQRFEELRKMGIRTVMVTGDNPMTAATIAAEAGVDDFIAEANPEIKLERIKEEQSQGHLVAMAGDGTNDAPALAQADVGVAMNTGTQPSREAGNMVDLDSNPTKLIEIIEIGKQLLMTRGALTTFSLSNDVAKYFAIIPAIFGGIYIVGNERYGPLSHLNLMHLHSAESAILSATIFNALTILALIPIALKGVAYKGKSAYELLLRNFLVYGLGGLVAPFIGIKLIDLLLVVMRLA